MPVRGALCLLLAPVVSLAAPAGEWKQLFNGKDLGGWDTYLAPAPGSKTPLGLNNDPRRVFTVVDVDGAPAMRISGEIYGAVTTKEEFSNFHIRVEFKWGEKRWPPRESVGRDSGILYSCVGPDGAGSQAWMRSVECNIMEKGTGQWWSVASAIIDVEGERVTSEMEPGVPYKKEGQGESIIVYRKGAPRIAAAPSDGITPSFDDERPRGEWNTVEVIFWAGNCIHLLNGKVNMVLTNPRHVDGGKVTPLRSGKIQLQSEAAELFYRKVEIRPIGEIPQEHLDLVPSAQDGEAGFKPILEKGAEGWAQSGKGEFALADGVATGKGGMGLWWFKKQAFGNFVLRGEFLQREPGANSGVFVRFPDPGGDPWSAVKNGHEIEIGDPDPEKPTWRTGSIYPFHASTTANTKPAGQWNEYEITCIGHDYSVRINGKLVSTWTDPDRRSTSGHIGLQNYDDGKAVLHRGLRVKELP
ncbi:MAG TPA: DUF1080 domain-containing protein [Planctomycetota bacterium]|nr:DUF1080 domain-containing protein [Planctomycetota bacterium]